MSIENTIFYLVTDKTEEKNQNYLCFPQWY